MCVLYNWFAANIALALKKDREGNIILNIDYYISPDIEPNLQGQGFCIHGLIPGAYLHTEETVYPEPDQGEDLTH